MANIPDIFTLSPGSYIIDSKAGKNVFHNNSSNGLMMMKDGGKDGSKDGSHFGNGTLPRKTHSPSSFIECGDVANATEAMLLRQKAALMAAKHNSFNNENNLKPPPVVFNSPPPPPPPPTPPLPPRIRKEKVRRHNNDNEAPVAKELNSNNGSNHRSSNVSHAHRRSNQQHSQRPFIGPEDLVNRPPPPPPPLPPQPIQQQQQLNKMGDHIFIEMPGPVHPPPLPPPQVPSGAHPHAFTKSSHSLRFGQPTDTDGHAPVTRNTSEITHRRTRAIKDMNRNEDRRISLITMRNSKKISLEFKNMTFSIWEGKGKNKREKQILKGINGNFKGGQLHCIMGPSGSGKTTLLNTLAGFNAKAAKALQVKIGDYRIEASRVFSGGNKFFCYITQDIELPAFLTVKETMTFATRLKMPNMLPGMTIDKFVDSLVGPLGLKSSLDTFVNNLSGGQRKRLAIATEIINYPPVLFADEPTSGLDSAMAEECIDLFRQMTKKGCNIITTIHQPSAKVFSHFSTLYCISRGECIYEGPTSDVLARLNTIGLTPPPFYSAADFILDIALGEAGEKKLKELIELTRERQLGTPSDDGQNIISKNRSNRKSRPAEPKTIKSGAKFEQVVPSFSSSNASFWSQTTALSERVLKTTCRNHMLFLFRITGLIAIGLLMGGIFFGDSKTSTPQILAILSSALFTSSFMPAVMGIPLDVKFMTTEYLNSWYQIPALAISTALTDCLLEIAHPLLFTIILWKMAHLRDDDMRMLRSSLISILSAWNGRSVGLVAGTFSSRMTSAYVAFGGMAPFFVFTGSVLPFNLAPVYLQWLFYANSCFYVFEAHLQQVYGGNYVKPAFNSSACIDPISVACIEMRQNNDGKFIIEQAFGFKDDDANFYKDLGILVAYFVGFRIIGSFTLYWRLRRELKRANNR